MRHKKGNSKLGLPTDQRLALIKNTTKALILHKKIKTTNARAKQVSKYVEKIITKAKKNDLHSRREVFRLIQDKKIVDIIFKNVIPQCQNRNSGYTRILKYGIRRGDAANISVLELI